MRAPPLRRSLAHYRGAHLAVVLCAAVAAAVLTGALVVGDSVRGSLRDLTLERLGAIDQAVRGSGFFTAELAARVEGELPAGSAVVPAVLLRGSARRPDTGALASGVSVAGVDGAFYALFPEGDSAPPGGSATTVDVNQALADELELAPGTTLLLAVERPGEAPRESLYGSAETRDVVRELRLTVRRILPDRGLGRFSLEASQALPFLALLDRDLLAGALGQEGRANTLLVDLPGEGGAGLDDPHAEDGSGPVAAALAGALSVEDLGLELREGDGWVAVGSRELVLPPPLEQAVERWASERGLPQLAVSAYLANRIEADGSAVPYSAIAALDPAAAAPFGGLALVSGAPAPALASGEILLDRWAADDLGVGAGAEVTLTYFEVGPREELLTRSRDFRVRGVVALAGLGADAGLTPDFPGISEADDMRAWDPPFPIDLDAIRPRDEEFWDRYRATPKAFLALEDASLWATRFGALTSIRLAPADGGAADGAAASSEARGVDELLADLRRELPRAAEPAAFGIRVEPVRARGLAASSGATDFRWLFLGFSSFLIGSAGILVALFFTLGVERRSSEIGLLLALGYTVKAVRRRLLGEGLLLGAAGIALGTAGAALYAGLMIAALRTWWRAAVGTPFLFLHLEPLTLLAGALSAFLVVALSIVLSVRRLGRIPVVALLRGATSGPEPAPGRPPRSRWVWRIALGLGLLLLVGGGAAGLQSSPIVFFAAGAALLVAGLALFAFRLRRPRRALRLDDGTVTLSARNAALHPGRSLLSATLVASAAFVIVAVAANGFRYGDEVDALDSPAGGYTVVAESAVPIHVDLSRPDVGFELGLQPPVAATLAASEIAGFRVLPGDDTSCLNLYQPERPRILGVPHAQVERGGFQFQAVAEERERPWTLLEDELEGGVVPAFGDFESMMWILKKGLGDELTLSDERGEPMRVRLVGLLEKSLFQSELLISEAAFERHFPSRTGRSFFLVDPPAGEEATLITGLESALDAYGLDAAPSRERLDRYQAVFNTYLATFQALGGLGLLLGTLGLAAILLRNTLERRGELATLRALGFPRSRLGLLVLAESSLLLLVGLGIGTGAALLAVAPHLLAGRAVVPWGSLVVTLILIVAVGTLAAAGAVRQALRAPLLPALKGD